MTTELLIALACLTVPPTFSASRKGIEARFPDNSPVEIPQPDKFGFMTWQWTSPPTPKGVIHAEHARAKFVSEKNGVVTIRTDRGQLVKIQREKVGRLQQLWLDAEMQKQDAKKAKALDAKP